MSGFGDDNTRGRNRTGVTNSLERVDNYAVFRKAQSLVDDAKKIVDEGLAQVKAIAYGAYTGNTPGGGGGGGGSAAKRQFAVPFVATPHQTTGDDITGNVLWCDLTGYTTYSLSVNTSNTGSGTFVLQYSTDGGTTWTDAGPGLAQGSGAVQGAWNALPSAAQAPCRLRMAIEGYAATLDIHFAVAAFRE